MSISVLERQSDESIQSQLRRSIIAAIHAGQMTPGQKLLPSRRLAEQLGIARNTVTAVYEELVARGYLDALPRQGYFVGRGLPADAGQIRKEAQAPLRGGAINWQGRLKQAPSTLRHIVKPSNWQDFDYPFIYGQVDPNLFPINTWRTCSRDALGRAAIDWWTADRAVEDDPLLIEQIRTQILPQRGIFVREDQILVTLGTQQGIYLLARLLARHGTRVGIEVPGYPDGRNIFAAEQAEIVDLPVDAEGADLSGAGPLDIAVLTPAHQCPTMVSMSERRRDRVYATARAHGTILIEDDFEGELSGSGEAGTLKSRDTDGRVVYLGTMSKVLAPGVRIGFMVADAALIREALWLRRLMHRSTPLNNQRTAGIFLAEGHYTALLRSLRTAHEARWRRMADGCDRHLPGFRRSPATGGSCLWLECPPEIDGRALAERAAGLGVLIESGDPFMPEAQAGRFIRLGISYISERRIDPGLERLGRAAREVGRMT